MRKVLLLLIPFSLSAYAVSPLEELGVYALDRYKVECGFDSEDFLSSQSTAEMNRKIAPVVPCIKAKLEMPNTVAKAQRNLVDAQARLLLLAGYEAYGPICGFHYRLPIPAEATASAARAHRA
jgi:hypothetical protein